MRAGAWVHPSWVQMCAAHTHTLIFSKKKIFFSYKKEKQNFLKFFLKKCASAGRRAGAKTGVQVHARHMTIFVQCACGCGPKSTHTKGLQTRIVALFSSNFLVTVGSFFLAKGQLNSE